MGRFILWKLIKDLLSYRRRRREKITSKIVYYRMVGRPEGFYGSYKKLIGHRVSKRMIRKIKGFEDEGKTNQTGPR